MTTWNLNGVQSHVLICNGSSCMRKEGEEITQKIRAEITARNLDEQIHTARTRCNGRCKDACVVVHYPKGDWYSITSEEEATRFVAQLAGEQKTVVPRITFENGAFVRNEDTPAIKGISKVKEEV